VGGLKKKLVLFNTSLFYYFLIQWFFY